MQIILITGQSGTGKTTICKTLCDNDKYNFINSYTDRELREKDEWGHIFVEPTYMDLLLERSDIVAQTNIYEKRYCTIRSQFDDNKINVYIVDLYGINDVFDAFPFADIMVILIRRDNIEADCVRVGRDVCVPSREDVDFVINNDSSIESVVGIINILVGFDFFKKPSHKVESINDKLKAVEDKERHLREIKESLLAQLWQLNYPVYKQLINYVSEQINNDFDFPINITPDTSPEIIDGYLTFNIIGEYSYEDADWATINSLVETLSYYAYDFCQNNGYEDLGYHLTIAEKYIGDEYG